eukprot:gene11478-11622_t
MASAKVAIIAGYGPGISSAVAKAFGANGFRLALLARTKSRLDAAAADLSNTGISAKGYPTDLSDAAAVKAAVAEVQADLGPINVLFWNPYGAVTSILSATPEQLQLGYNTSITGLVAATQAAHPDLQASKGAILVTGGGLSLESDFTTKMAVDYGMMTLAVNKAAQRKLVHVLHESLKKDGIYVAEVTVMGAVAGTPSDPEGNSAITPEGIAQTFWDLLQTRDHNVWFVKYPSS